MYGTDLMQRRTREWATLESNPLCSKISSIQHRVWVNAPAIHARGKDSQMALTVSYFYFISAVVVLHGIISTRRFWKINSRVNSRVIQRNNAKADFTTVDCQ